VKVAQKSAFCETHSSVPYSYPLEKRNTLPRKGHCSFAPTSAAKSRRCNLSPTTALPALEEMQVKGKEPKGTHSDQTCLFLVLRDREDRKGEDWDSIRGVTCLKRDRAPREKGRALLRGRLQRRLTSRASSPNESVEVELLMSRFVSVMQGGKIVKEKRSESVPKRRKRIRDRKQRSSFDPSASSVLLLA
jgi:hypothetical protein